MPWKDVTVSEQKQRFIEDYLLNYYSVTELAERFNISRKTAHKWINQYLEQGPAGLAKYAMGEYSGKTSIKELAAASAQSEVTVQKGLEWLVAQGLISIKEEPDESLLVTKGGPSNKELSENLLNDIQELLRETEAYRSHYLNADKETLL